MSDDRQAPEQQTSDNRSVEEIEADIAATRRDLGQTIDALGHQLDVKTRISTSVRSAPQRIRAAVTAPDGRPRPQALAAAGAVVVVVAAVVVVRRRRS